MKRVRFLEEARRELLAEISYCEKLQVGLGDRFRIAVERTTSSAASYPFASSRSAAETRRVIVNGFPSSVAYRPEPTGIVVFAIARFRGNPAYWVARK